MKTRSATCPVAVVTGASRGIGRAVAKGLAVDGYRVALIARDRLALEGLCEEVALLGAPEPRIFAVDVTDTLALADAIEILRHDSGRVDLLFNNAAIVRRGTSVVEREPLHEMWRTNFLASLYLAQLVSPLMIEQRAGHIINMSSRSARFPKAKNGGYAATKAALATFGAALYQELAQYGVKVTTILPSYTDTDQSAGQTWLAKEARIRPDDILQSVRFLLSLSPSASIQEIMLDCTHVVAHGENYI